MSRQLKFSATLSVLTMAFFALLGSHAARDRAEFALPQVEAKASASALPAIGNLLPGQK